MKTTTTYSAASTGFSSAIFHRPVILKSFGNWIEGQQQNWENNRLGISATGIFLQVSVAATMIAILGMAGAPVLIYTIGILFAFLANSFAFAQSPMKVVIAMFVTSIIFNVTLTLYYVLKLLGY